MNFTFNSIITESPSPWNSAHKPIVYKFQTRVSNNVAATDSGGNVLLTLSTIGIPPNLALNGATRVFIPSGIYQGTHKVISNPTTLSVVIDLPYVSNQTLNGVRVVCEPIIDILIGYKTGEQYPSQLPLTLVAQTKLIFNQDFECELDVSGYLADTFTISDVVSVGVDFSRFNRFRLRNIGIEGTAYQVLNSAIEHSELNDIVNNNGWLAPNGNLVVSSCGLTLGSKIEANTIINFQFDPNVTTFDFNDDFLFEDFDAEPLIELAPNDVTNLQLWLEADTGITLNGSNVSSWQDQSPNAFLFEQATALRQPLLTTDAGKPTIKFNETDWNVLITPTINTSIFQNKSEFTCFMIFRNSNLQPSTDLVLSIARGNANTFRLAFGINSNNRRQLWTRLDDANTITFDFNGLSGANTKGISIFGLQAQNVEPATHYVQNQLVSPPYNNTPPTIPTVSVNDTSRFICIGANNAGGTNPALDIELQAILFYDRVLTDIERTGVYNYLNNKWS